MQIKSDSQQPILIATATKLSIWMDGTSGSGICWRPVTSQWLRTEGLSAWPTIFEVIVLRKNTHTTLEKEDVSSLLGFTKTNVVDAKFGEWKIYQPIKGGRPPSVPNLETKINALGDLIQLHPSFFKARNPGYSYSNLVKGDPTFHLHSKISIIQPFHYYQLTPTMVSQ